LTVALAGCSGEADSSIEDLGANLYNDPGANPSNDPGSNESAPAGFAVSYQTGNGKGSPPQPQLITKNTTNLPDATGLIAPDGATEFVGWNDGMLTYPKDYEYTVTGNVTFNARWAFTALGDIKTHLTNAGTGAPVLIAVSGGEPSDGNEANLTWKNLLSAIETAGVSGKTVELDLSGSTLALFDEGGGNKKFDYKDGNNTSYSTGEQYIKKLVLPNAATSITIIYDKYEYTYSNEYIYPFSILESESGLNVSAIPDNAFGGLPKLEAVVFPTAKTIGANAFKGCTKLNSVSLPVAKTIDTQAFCQCESLTSVSLPAAEKIGVGVFNMCFGLTKVSLPAAEKIDDYAIYGCPALAEVNLPKATSIGESAFDYSKDLAAITIGANCDIDNDSGIHDNFKAYYEGTAQAAGVYTYNSGTSSWSYAPLK
jgi:hypothetical protein